LGTKSFFLPSTFEHILHLIEVTSHPNQLGILPMVIMLLATRFEIYDHVHIYASSQWLWELRVIPIP
jgi:hypothetical protein